MKTENLHAEIKKQAAELAAREILTETNEGTYGGDNPQFANYRIYTRVGDGRERREGASEDRAPGYARKFRENLAAAQKELQELRRQIR